MKDHNYLRDIPLGNLLQILAQCHATLDYIRVLLKAHPDAMPTRQEVSHPPDIDHAERYCVTCPGWDTRYPDNNINCADDCPFNHHGWCSKIIDDSRQCLAAHVRTNTEQVSKNAVKRWRKVVEEMEKTINAEAERRMSSG